MLLRRVIEHVRDQNWTAIGIDFLIVVVGVFVATEVSDWNTERATKARAKVFTERLADDLRLDAWGWEYTLAYSKEVLIGAEAAVAGGTGDASVSDEDFLIGAYRATQVNGYTLNRSTYDELVSTGEIGLITDPTLHATATRLYTPSIINGIVQGQGTSEYRRAFRRRIPVDVQRALLLSCGDRFVEPLDYKGITGTIGYECDLDLPADRIASAASMLRSDPEFLPALQSHFADLESRIFLLSQDFQGKSMRTNLQRIAGLDP